MILIIMLNDEMPFSKDSCHDKNVTNSFLLNYENVKKVGDKWDNLVFQPKYHPMNHNI